MAAINVIYYAGKSCRGWIAHHMPTQIPEVFHHHEQSDAQLVDHGTHEGHHYLHEHTVDEDANDIEGWTLRDVIEDRLGIFHLHNCLPLVFSL